MEKFSYSKLSTYKQCGYQYKLRYVDKHYIFSGSIATEFGTAIHETEENIAHCLQENRPINYNQIKNEFLIKCHKVAQKYPIEFVSPDKSGKTYQEKMYYYLENTIYDLEKYMKDNPSYQIVGIEQKFLFDYDEEHCFNGAIDRVFLDTASGTLIVQDIKSWPKPAIPSELKAPLQFAVYAMAAEKIYGIKPENMIFEYFLPLCDGGLAQRVTSTDILKDTKKEFDKLFGGIADEDFHPSVTALCHWCQHNPMTNPSLMDTDPDAICPYGSTWQKSGDPVKNTIIPWKGNIFTESMDKQLYIAQMKNMRKEV